MKKIFTLLCAAVIAVSTMNAEVLFSESFDDFSAGRLSKGAWGSGNLPSDGWYTNGGTSVYRQVTEDAQLTYKGYCSSTSGKATTTSGNTQKDYILLDKQKASLSSGEKYYLSFLLNVKTLKGSDNAKTGYNTIIAGLLTDISRSAISYTQGVVVVKEKDENSFYLGVRKKNETQAQAVYGETVLSINQTYLIVMEYDVVSGDNNDVAKLYINPSKSEPAIEVSTADGTGAASYTDATAFVGVGLLIGSHSPTATTLDEVKVTTSWDDLWEAGEAPQTPTIIADQSFSFGNVNVNEAANQNLTIKGSNLKGAISIVSDNAQLVVSAASVTKEAAEAEEGAAVSLTLTATAAGEGSAKITLSSEDAADKVINVTWNAVAPVSKISIAEAKKLAPEAEVNLNDVVVTRIFQDGLAFTVQDATGALNLADYFGACTSWTVGDKISGLKGAVLASEDYIEGFFTVFPAAGNVAASGVAIEPLAVTLADFTKYGPAYIKVEGVSFPSEIDKFAAGGITISQDAASANMQIPAGCDIIGEDVPSKADVKGLVCHPYLTDNILIEKSADVYNRVAKEPTGFENVQSIGKAVKVVRDGQLIILRDGKEYNVLGAEK